MTSRVNYHKDPLRLMSGKIPQDYRETVWSLIRPDEPSPIKQEPSIHNSNQDRLPKPQTHDRIIYPTTPEKTFQCQFCEKAFPFKYTKDRHEILHNRPQNANGNTYTCSDAPENSENGADTQMQTSMDSTNVDHRTNNGFECKVCKKVMYDKANLKRHVLTHETPTYPKCNICCQTLKSDHQLKKHQRDIHGHYKCTDCHYKCKDKRDLKCHTNCLQCTKKECTFVTQTKRQFKLHQLKCLGFIQCEVCQKTYSRYGNYNIHFMKEHPTEMQTK